ncbi:MAG: glycosyltransferase [Actinomycetota bacterium]|nr:glycosyltransferase [Actinomycetota bacterium]
MRAEQTETTGTPARLQRLLLPTVERCTLTELYARLHGGAWHSLPDSAIQLPASSAVEFDTYFGGFSVGKWRRHTNVRSVTFTLDASGEFEVQAVLHHRDRATRTVAAALLRSDDVQSHDVGPINLDELGDGLLHLSVRARTDTVIHGGAVSTPDAPAVDARLGVVITTFNRPSYLHRNIAGLVSAFEADPSLAARLRIVVVDNARNVPLDIGGPAPIEVIPNRNLGGAGGFARGLMHHRDQRWATHVLFMDDDISFEPDVVERTLAVLAHAADPDLCVAGAMLTEEHPHIQFEAGATFLTRSIHPFRPIGGGLDLSRPRPLVENEEERPSGYGAWWFFAFPVHLATVNPLPVFVRGDDVLFGLRHLGRHTMTMNGIGVWHQQFAQKNGPAAYYYEARNLPLVCVLADEGYSAAHLTRRFLFQTMRMLSACKYDTAEAQIAGIRQFLQGPDAWMALDHEQVHQAVRAHAGERPGALSRDELAVPKYSPTNPLVPKIVGAAASALGGGHLLPKRFSRRAARTVELSAWSPAATFGREQVVYRYDPTGEGFVADRDRDRFKRLVIEAFDAAAQIKRDFDRVALEYRSAYDEMTSDKYWLGQFETRTGTDYGPGLS